MNEPAAPSLAETAFSWIALPVYVWQGLGVRRRTHRMAPPAHPGTLEFPGEGKRIDLLVLGDSSAAGVGVDDIADSFAALLPRFLAERTGRPVKVRIVGMNSATSAQIRDYAVPHIEPRDFDYVALNIGTNDAKNYHSGRRFKKDFGTLLYALRARFPAATIVWSGVIDMAGVPALPKPLNRILSIRSRLIDRIGRILCRERGALCPPPEWRVVPENFSADGFHASAAGYREWADGLADWILALEDHRTHPGPVPAEASFVG